MLTDLSGRDRASPLPQRLRLHVMPFHLADERLENHRARRFFAARVYCSDNQDVVIIIPDLLPVFVSQGATTSNPAMQSKCVS